MDMFIGAHKLCIHYCRVYMFDYTTKLRFLFVSGPDGELVAVVNWWVARSSNSSNGNMSNSRSNIEVVTVAAVAEAVVVAVAVAAIAAKEGSDDHSLCVTGSGDTFWPTMAPHRADA